MTKRKSVIWTLPRQEFENIINTSSSYKEALITMGFAIKSGGNYKTLKKRIQEDNIDVSHIEANRFQFRGTQKKIPLESILVKESSYNNYHLKKRLLNEGLLNNECYKCDTSSEWQGEPLALQMDHINGDHNDNRLENLRILCPNCHSQTETYGGRNIKNPKLSKKWFCKCGNRKYKKANVCIKCYSPPEKIQWPPNDELIERSNNQSLLSLSKELGVSDSAIRKRLKKIM